jgi:hypothetical protein
VAPSESLRVHLTDESAASVWAFARATLGDPAAAEIAVRAAFVEAWPAVPASEDDRARILVALGRAEGFVRSRDPRLPAAGSTPFDRAFRSLAWPVQVVVWGRAIDALDDDTIRGALGPVGDPARALLRPYLVELARTAPLGCAEALTRAAARVDGGRLHRLEDLEPHLEACELCRSAFPLRAARSLCRLASPDTPMPPALVHQIDVDHARARAGLELRLGAERPASRRSAIGVLALGGAAVAFALYATIGRGPTGGLATGAARGAAGAAVSETTALGGAPVTQAAAGEPAQTTTMAPAAPAGAPSVSPAPGPPWLSASARRVRGSRPDPTQTASPGPAQLAGPTTSVGLQSPSSATTSAPLPGSSTSLAPLLPPPSAPSVPPPAPPPTETSTTATPTTTTAPTTTSAPTTTAAPTTTIAPTTTVGPTTTIAPTTTAPAAPSTTAPAG